MKRILLVFPYMGDECVPLLPPLSACFLSVSARKTGWHLDLLDGQVYKRDNLLKWLNNCVQEYDAFGISVYSGFVKPAISIAKLIRRSSSAPIIWGGPHPTLFPSQLENHDLADFVVTGCGEQPLECLLRNNFNCEHRILHGECGPALSTYSPDYAVCDIERYWASGKGRVLGIITSRGCRYSCRFCINSVQKKVAVFMEEHSVEATIADLALRYGIDTLHVWDEHFYKNDERVLWFCDLMRKYNVSWQANLRADIVVKLSDDAMSALARSGCRRINMGLESASDRVLKVLGKGIRVSDYLGAVDRCMTYGVPISASFMIDLPTETAQEKTATLTMARLLRGIGVVVFGPMRYRPVPGTVLTDRMVHEGLLKYPSTLEEWANSSFASKYVLNDWENVSW